MTKIYVLNGKDMEFIRSNLNSTVLDHFRYLKTHRQIGTTQKNIKKVIKDLHKPFYDIIVCDNEPPIDV